MSILRWGILGTAHVNRRVIPALRASERGVLSAVASRDPYRAEALAREWDIPHALHGYDLLLGRPDIDAVYVPLPNSLHVEWTLAAIAAGKHVLCEKPLALDPHDVDRVAAAAVDAGVVVEEGVMYRHEPLTARVVSLVRDGAVGAVRAIVTGFTFTQTRAGDVRLDAALGGGALWDIGCYPVSYACLLAGRDAKMVFGSAHWLPSGVDEEFMGMMRFPGSVTATVYAGFRAAYRTWLEVLGSEGALTVPNPFRPGPRERLLLERSGGTETVDVEGSNLLFLREVEDFTAAVLDGAPPMVSLADSRRTVAALAALHASARSEQPHTGASSDRRAPL